MSDDFDWTPYLQDGEEVLWQGRPDGRYKLFLSRWDLLIVPFFFVFLLVSGLIVFTLVLQVATFPIAGEIDLMGETLPFALSFPVSLFMVFGRARLDQKRRQRYRYAVTSGRVLRADAAAGKILSSKAITPDLTVDVTLGRLTSIRLDPWFKKDQSPESVMPMDLRPKGARDPRSTQSIGLYTGFHQLAFNGYDELGLELRLLPDGREVAKLLRDLKSKSSEATP